MASIAIDAAVAAISTAIGAAVTAGIEAAVQVAVGAAVEGAFASSLVSLGVADETAAATAAELAGLEVDPLAQLITQFLIHALGLASVIAPEAPLLLYTVPESVLGRGGEPQSVPHLVEQFANKIGEQLSPELKAELTGKVKKALKSAEDDAMKYLSKEKALIMEKSLIPFYGWVDGPIELSHLKDKTMGVLHAHANANVAKVKAQWESDDIVKDAIGKAVEEFTKTDEWKKYVAVTVASVRTSKNGKVMD
mmetsp:Transcript_24472/g.70529  ORF Transcript_24472/g.70529 Transcript_24472/m.70529 type:complete len:251 (-) Transcript_24472:300-1052(-)